MDTLIRTFQLAALLAIPSALTAQDLAIGARAGTLGFGAEAVVGLSDNLAIRGGLGSCFYEWDGDYDEVTYTVSPPSLVGTLGVDFYPAGGSFRLMAGLMFRDGDFEGQSGDLSEAGGVELGDSEYDQAGTLHGSITSKSTAPFLGLGFGHHTQGGFGLFLDLGVAFVGDPEVGLTAQGPIASVQGIQEDLVKEAQKVEDDLGSYLNYWPILSFGVKIPLG
jgi:hypothetical protein